MGIVPLSFSATYNQDYQRFRAWIDQGKHAGLAYLERYEDCRREPERLLKGSKTAVIFGLPYAQGDSWPPSESEGPRTAQYARFRDYHHLLKERGERVIQKLRALEAGQGHEFRLLVDSAPVLERALAVQTREGFIGKNTCYIHPERGSFLLLGELLTTFPLTTDAITEKQGCGSCTLCQAECPTGALNTDYVIDSNRCLSYWTIEQRGTIPEEFWPWLSKYYFGCDICQLVCPYNTEARDNRLPQDIELRKYPSLFEIAVMDQKQYEKSFGGTPMTRAKRAGLRRNALIALCVLEDSRLPLAMERVSSDGGFPLEETVMQIKKYRETQPN